MRMTPLRWVMGALLLVVLPALLVAPLPEFTFEQLFGRDPVSRTWFDYRNGAALLASTEHSRLLRNHYLGGIAKKYAQEPFVAASGSTASVIMDARGKLRYNPGQAKELRFDSVFHVVQNSVEQIRLRTATGSLGDVRAVVQMYAPTDSLFNAAKTHYANSTLTPWAVMPPALDGTTCKALYPIGMLRTFATHSYGVLGPCFLQAAFGRPGRGMQDFLWRTHYEIPSYLSPDHVGLADGAVGTERRPAFERENEIMAIFLERSWPDANRLPCFAYGGYACDSLVMLETANRARFRQSYGDPNVVPLTVNWYSQSAWELGVVYDEIGAVPFAQLWRSDKPLEESFTAITGETRAGFERRILIRRAGTTYHPGPWPTAPTLLTILALCAAVYGLAMQFSPRPRVA